MDKSDAALRRVTSGRNGTEGRALASKRSQGTSRARQNSKQQTPMIRKLPSGKYRLYSHKRNPRTGKRRNLGTFPTRAAAEKHERAVQYFKRH
jgi:hypothetical protein